MTNVKSLFVAPEPERPKFRQDLRSQGIVVLIATTQLSHRIQESFLEAVVRRACVTPREMRDDLLALRVRNAAVEVVPQPLHDVHTIEPWRRLRVGLDIGHRSSRGEAEAA